MTIVKSTGTENEREISETLAKQDRDALDRNPRPETRSPRNRGGREMAEKVCRRGLAGPET